MAYRRPEHVVRWSLSGFHSWRDCPFRFKIERILRTGATSSDAMARGDRIHKLIERFLKGEPRFTFAKLSAAVVADPPMKNGKPAFAAKTLAERFANFKDELEAGRKAYKKKVQGALVEDGFAFDANWIEQPITDDYRTTNWGPIWLSGKIDFGAFPAPTRLDVTDWKTGQIREDEIPKYIEQLELYALVSFLRYPSVEVVTPSLAYLDVGEYYEDRFYERGELPLLIKAWNKRVKPMFADRAFKPCPNKWCGWCAYGKQRGDGRCKY